MTGADGRRVLVVSPRGLVRSAVAWALSAMELTVIECAEAGEAGRDAQRITPELVLADLDFEWDAVCAGGFARWCAGLPGPVRVIALAASSESGLRVPAGCQVLAPDASAAALARLVARTIADPASPGDLPVLTVRQGEVLERAARGFANHDIGRALLISTGTVKRHLHDAFTSLGAQSRAEAVALARSHGLI